MSLELKTVASFFSGCGGMDLGLEGGFRIKKSCVRNSDWIEADYDDEVLLKTTGLKTVFACDIKKPAKAAWESYFGRDNVFHLESIVDLVKRAKEGSFVFPDADIVTGGFPCQDFSLAGKRGGFDSHKTHKNTYDEGPTIESRGMLYYWLREAIAIIKPKLFIAENVKGLASMEGVKEIITQDFRNIGSGYLVVDPQVLHAGDYGISQTRERIFFIGISRDIMPAELSEQIESGQISLYPPKTHCRKTDFVALRNVIGDLREPEESNEPSQRAYSQARYYGKHCQGNIEVNLDGLAPTIRSEHHGNIEFRRLDKENGGKNEVEWNLGQRRLTVRECARIQSFPDDFAFVQKQVSGSSAYKLVGNAVPPFMAYHILQHLKTVFEQNNNAFSEGKRDETGH